jgi:hypothetical protein
VCYYIAFGRLRLLELYAFDEQLLECIFTSLIESALDKSALERVFCIGILTRRIAMDRTENGCFI